MIKYLDKNDFNEEIKEGLILVDFYADWCGPCQAMGPVLDELDVNILKVNVDENEEIAAKYGIMSIPTLILFNNGEEKKKLIGFRTKEEIMSFIEENK